MIAPPSIASVQSLLKHTKRVQELHKAQDLGRDGRNFNLFHLLGIGHREVSTHSPILRDLLDPHGSHGQGAIFLRCFVRRLGLPELDFENAKVRPEVSIGAVTATSGGRLDLVISDGTTKRILIENKIFAGEQANWVSRYINHAPGATLVFLSLEGEKPVNMPKEGRPANLVCASYRSHITDWLRDCRKEAATAPIVRESITQYLHLVQELTHQSPASAMNDQLVKTATEDRESLAAYFALCRVEREVQIEIIRHLQGQLRLLAEKLGYTFQGQSNWDYSDKGGFEFRSTAMDALPLRIRFEFDKTNYQDFAFGFVDEGKLPAEERTRLKLLFTQAYENPKSNEAWPAWIHWSRYQNWTAGDTFAEIRFGNFVRDVENELKKLHSIALRLRETGDSEPKPTELV